MLQNYKFIKIILLIIVGYYPTTSNAIGDINIVVSIKPLHDLVSSVIENIAKPPNLLVPAIQSPHNYSLTPKNMHLLNNAKVIFWSGTDAEAFMYSALNQKKLQAKSINLATVKKLTLITRKGLQDNCPNCKSKNSTHIQDIDPHYWLNPNNAIILVNTIAEYMSNIDPQNTEAYVNNALKTKIKLMQLDKDLRTIFKTVENVPFIVLHNAYQYLQKCYNLNCLGALTTIPGLGLSPRRLQKIYTIITEQQPVCIFSEPQIDTKSIDSILSQAPYKIHTAVIDPIGVNVAMGATGYFDLMHDIAKNIHSCLSKSH